MFFVAKNHYLNWTIIFLPVVNLPLIFLILGFTWFLSSIGVFIKDIAHTIHIFTMSLLFLSPVFYSVDALPKPYRELIYLNPLTTIIEQNRAILIWGHLPNWHDLGISLLIGFLIAAFGYYWFEKTRHAFADVV